MLRHTLWKPIATLDAWSKIRDEESLYYMSDEVAELTTRYREHSLWEVL